MNKDLQEKIYDLLSRKLAGNATLDELQELDTLLKIMPDFKYLHDQLIQFPELDSSSPDDITDQAYAAQYVKILYADKDARLLSAKAVITDGNNSRRKFYFIRMAGIAAAIVLFIIIAQLLFFKKAPMDTGMHVMSNSTAKAGNGKSKLTLPDGTTVYLNANSYIQYDGDFNKTTRNVTLTGEAYFNVAHDTGKPFIVHTSKATIKVLGTKFNVKNYSDEIWEATLLQGKIEMYLNSRPKDKLQLEPSQKVSIVADNNQMLNIPQPGDYKISVTKVKTLDNDIAETAWIANKLIFFDEPLHEIAKDLERAFGITVKILSPETAEKRYTGTFKNDNLQQILEILNLSNPIDYKLNEDVLIIK